MKRISLLLVGCGMLAGQADRLPARPVEGFPGPVGQDGAPRIVRQKGDVAADWFLDHADLFTATREEFEKQFPKGTYAWQDKEKSRARFNPDRVNLKLRDQEGGETIVSFKEGKISGVIISVLNKGDDGLIKLGEYTKAIEGAKKTLKEVAKVTESVRRKNETVSKADGLVWSTKKALYMLEYLWVPEEIRDGYRWYAHAEFVRIRILPPQVLLGMQQNTLKTNISRPTLAKRVKKDGTKVFLEGIPMVDQGSKGYCAVAAFERVMRYYGSQVDMHDLADLANSHGGGTSPSGIKDAVHKMAVRTGLRTREPVFMQGKDFLSMKNAYNREAKKANADQAEFGMMGVPGLYRDMDPDVFKAMRAKDAGFAKFGSEVARSINAGIPVMWALQLGMFWEDGLEDSYEASRGNPETDSETPEPDGDQPQPKAEDADADADADADPDKKGDADDESKDKPATDPGAKEDKPEETVKPAVPVKKPTPPRPKRPPPYMSGGHMRLIVGFDAKERVIYYSDSWGPGHEMKKMSLEEAWAVTMGLFIVEP